eukprot:TRINITY_DN558_c0_g2_i1.p2 TRINITY_DN558_c0_g2~~TRINITY_DN558_c0_g2_i1.p2  ORF type:complete len:117 (+),score=55.96 TRINITY_DN558_c0_g2_i1:148-498(+)
MSFLARFATSRTTSVLSQRIQGTYSRGYAETVKEKVADVAKKTADAFKADGKIGKEFTETGKVGGTAQKVGGPFDKEGAVGKQFTDKGAVGGNVQKGAEKAEGKAKEVKKDEKQKK